MKNKEIRILGLNSQVTTLSIKCYEEQMPKGWKFVKNAIKRFPKQNAFIIAIKHDRDTNYDKFWKPAIEKPHYHILFIMKDLDKSGRTKRIRINNIMNILGIEYRPEIDDELWKNHGVETIKNVPNMVTYLTHDTDEAAQQGKEKYELTELVSNISIAEIEAIRAEYLAPKVKRQKAMVSKKEMAEYDEIAYQLGLTRQDWDEFYNSLPFGVRDNSSIRTVEKRYQCGLEQAIYGKSYQLTRTCIFIQGEKNVGKTYAAEAALRELGKKILCIEESGTGKFDNLKATTDAIIIDDASIDSLLNMSDNKICHAYRRNSNNPYWCGEYLIVTSNNSFEEWMNSCGGFSLKNQEAIISRFIICEVITDEKGNKKLHCTSSSVRGSQDVKKERYEKYKAFALLFTKIINQYKPSVHDKYDFDYNDIYTDIIESDETICQTDEEKTEDARTKAFSKLMYDKIALQEEDYDCAKDYDQIPEEYWNCVSEEILTAKNNEKFDHYRMKFTSKAKFKMLIEKALNINNKSIAYKDYCNNTTVVVEPQNIMQSFADLIDTSYFFQFDVVEKYEEEELPFQ